MVGEEIADRWKLTGVLGQGSYSTAYRAADSHSRTDVVVRLALPRLSVRAPFQKAWAAAHEGRARQRAEATVTILAHGMTDQLIPYAVEELVPGTSLQDLIQYGGGLAEGPAVRILDGVVTSLTAVDRVHGDLKPSAVRLSRRPGGEEDPLLRGYCAREIRTAGQVPRPASSLPYVAPEVWRNEQAATVASDVYSLGCLAYYLLTAADAVRVNDGPADNKLQRYQEAHVSGRLNPIAQDLQRRASPAFADLVARMVAPAPNERPPVAEVARTLRSLARF